MYKPTKSEADEQIISQFVEQVDRIDTLLRRGKDNQAEAAIQKLISDLEALALIYLSTEVARNFKKGSLGAITELRKIMSDVATEFTETHTLLAKQQTEIIKQGFVNAIDNVRKNVAYVKSQGIISKLLNTNATERDITRINVGGRLLTVEHYISQVVYTGSATTQNIGALSRYLDNGIQYVKVVERASAPDRACQWMNGKIIKVGDLGLTPPLHPNCFGSVIPVLDVDVSQVLTGIDDPRIPEDVRKVLKRG